MSALWLFLSFLFRTANAVTIRLLECNQPDKPIGGGYVPIKDTYIPGDTIQYYCEDDSDFTGDYFRNCEDNGDWSGNTPICDYPSAFSSISQTSTSNELFSEAEFAFDGRRDTCSSTAGAVGDEWYGIFLAPGEVIRVLIFFQKGPVNFTLILVDENGNEIECGKFTRNIDRYDWMNLDCARFENESAKGVKIKSLTSEPLTICEVNAYVLTSPMCDDPHIEIDNGYLEMNRKKAVLTCDSGYIRSRQSQVECVQEDVWERRSLFCKEPDWEERDPDYPNSRRPENPDREREKVRVTPRPGP